MNRLFSIVIVTCLSLLSLNSFAKDPKPKLYVITHSNGGTGVRLSEVAVKALKADKKIKAAFEISRIETKQLMNHPLGDKDQALIVLGTRWLNESDFTALNAYVNNDNASQVAWYSDSTGSCLLLKTSEKEPATKIFKAHPTMNCFESGFKSSNGYIHYLVQQLAPKASKGK